MSAQTADGPEAEEIPTEDAITRLRFRLDGLKELVRRIWAAMNGEDERGPQDYDAFADERRLLINIIKQQTSSAGGGNYNEAPKSNITAIVIGCTITLLSAFVIGAWKLSNDQAAFIAQVTEWQKSIERRIDALERRP